MKTLVHLKFIYSFIVCIYFQNKCCSNENKLKINNHEPKCSVLTPNLFHKLKHVRTTTFSINSLVLLLLLPKLLFLICELFCRMPSSYFVSLIARTQISVQRCSKAVAMVLQPNHLWCVSVLFRKQTLSCGWLYCC